MQFLNYILASVISYLGLIAGMLLIFMGPEEKRPGTKYFILMQKVVFLMIMFFFLYYYNLNIYLIIVLMAILILLSFYVEIRKPERQYIIYILLGIIFYLSSRDIGSFITEASLIFIYGIPTASLLTDIGKKKRMKSLKGILKYSYFIVIASALYFFFS